ncbi:MAG: putative CRISPR-associated protein [Candidatus Obscuribacterales bacterium]|nr:putative CRISPR-associated protein [Candidatus Obscuribacterales bacterium]
MNFILSTCGTSSFRNGATPDELRLLNKYSNASKAELIPIDDRLMLEELAKRAGRNLLQSNCVYAALISAELNAIAKYYDNNIQVRHKKDYHVLLCTDTWLGEQVAINIQEWMRTVGLTAEVKRQQDLQTADLTAFQLALSGIAEWCEDTIPQYQSNNYRIIFNLTGGFKSVNGFLQALSMFYADEAIYVFESEKELLRLPRLPVQITATETIHKHLLAFRRLSCNLPVEHIADDIPETLLFKLEQQIALSPWGMLVWKRAKKEIYGEHLLSPPSQRISFTAEFEASVQGLTKERLRIVNERLDDLAQFFELGQSRNRLYFKKLKGNPRPPSTHEIDAWADHDTKRIFGHFEGDVFILNQLGKALH